MLTAGLGVSAPAWPTPWNGFVGSGLVYGGRLPNAIEGGGEMAPPWRQYNSVLTMPYIT